MQLAEGPQVALVQPRSAPRNREQAWKAEEAADRARMPKVKRDHYLEVLGCTYYTEGMVLSSDRTFAKFWRALPEIRCVLDPLEKGQTLESAAWRGKLARANGWRWVAFIKGERIDDDKLREAAGR